MRKVYVNKAHMHCRNNESLHCLCAEDDISSITHTFINESVAFHEGDANGEHFRISLSGSGFEHVICYSIFGNDRLYGLLIHFIAAPNLYNKIHILGWVNMFLSNLIMI